MIYERWSVTSRSAATNREISPGDENVCMYVCMYVFCCSSFADTAFSREGIARQRLSAKYEDTTGGASLGVRGRGSKRSMDESL